MSKRRFGEGHFINLLSDAFDKFRSELQEIQYKNAPLFRSLIPFYFRKLGDEIRFLTDVYGTQEVSKRRKK